VPIYLRANVELSLSGLSFSLGIEGSAEPLRFAPADANPPTLLDNALPGVLALSWFKELQVASGQSALLGFVEFSASAGAPTSLRFFGFDANAGPDGHTVYLSSPAFQATKPRIDTQ
jgi:hypothetical protein